MSLLTKYITDPLGITGNEAPQLSQMSAEDFGFDQNVLDQAQSTRADALARAMNYQGGFMSRARDSFGRQTAGLDEASSLRGEGAGLFRGLSQFDQPIRNITQEGLDRSRGYINQLGDISSRQQAMIGRDRAFYRDLEGQSQGIQQDIASRVGQLDQLRRQADERPTGLANALTARARENIQRDAQGRQLALNRTMSARGINPQSVQALNAMQNAQDATSEAKRRASQDAFLNANRIQAQNIAQQSGLIGQGIGAQLNRQNVLSQLRAGRAQEFGQDMSALGQTASTIAQGANQNMSRMSAGIGAYGRLADLQRAQAQGLLGVGAQAQGAGQYAGGFGMQNQQGALGLDQMQMQDAIFDINRMQQARLARLGANQQINATNAQMQASQPTFLDSASKIAGIGASVKMIAMCIPEGTAIDVGNGVSVNIRDIKVGQEVVGYNGEKVKVLQKHEYLEDPTQERFLNITFDNGAEIDLCDQHKVSGIRSGDLKVGDKVGEREVTEIKKYADIQTSYDLLTEDQGYQISGIPVNSMIEELADMISYLRKAF